MKIDNPQEMIYVLVQWPETQELMDEEWFDKEASLADFDKFGNSAYFIPQKRWLNHNKYIEIILETDKLSEESLIVELLDFMETELRILEGDNILQQSQLSGYDETLESLNDKKNMEEFLKLLEKKIELVRSFHIKIGIHEAYTKIWDIIEKRLKLKNKI